VRKPDEVSAHSIAVYYGDQALPEAAALAHIRRARGRLTRDPQVAVREAKTAVALDPSGFDANRALGNALAAAGDRDGARAALTVALRRTTKMEPGGPGPGPVMRLRQPVLEAGTCHKHRIRVTGPYVKVGAEYGLAQNANLSQEKVK
jgi:hypothetical protein